MRKAIENVVNSDNPANASLLEHFLNGLSRIYAAAVKVRLACYRSGICKTRRLPCKVVSIGNITVGGTGKTPFTIYVAELVHRWGLRAAVISRGYKGEAERSGTVVGDGSQLLVSPQMAGDEPFLLAARLTQLSVPVLVGRDRIRMGLKAIEKFQPDVILLDDGFQHIRLARDVDVVLLDSQRPFGNRHLLPRGVLRESLSSLQRADLYILTRSAAKDKYVRPGAAENVRSLLPRRPIFRAAHMPALRVWIEAGQQPGNEQLLNSSAPDNQRLDGCRAFAFSGIADNEAFRRSLANLGIDVSGFIGFADHHAYSDGDLSRIMDAAHSTGADCLCTTDKDWVKIPRQVNWPLAVAVMGVGISLGREAHGFEEQLRSLLNLHG